MKELLFIEDTIANKISYYHIVFFLVALPFDRFYSQLVLISLIIHSLIHVKKKELKSIFSRDILILQSVYIITILTTIYTVNKSEAFALWTRQLAILLFPLILYVNPINIKKYLNNFLSAFSITCVALVLYLYFDALQIISYYQLPLSSLLSNSFLNHNFSEPIGLHATYFAMYIAISLAFTVNLLIHSATKLKQVLLTVVVLILVTGLIQLASRAVLFSVLLILNCAFLLVLQKKQKLIFISITVLFSALLIFTISEINIYKDRYFTELEADLTNDTHIDNSAEPRMERWKLAVDLIKQAPIIGYGSGEEVAVLSERYFEAKLYSSYLNKLNAHNQYLSFLLKGGVVALFIYLFTIFYSFKVALKFKHSMLLSFMILISIVSVSENILEVNKGIFFYSFFFSIFICSIKKQYSENSYERLE